MKTDNKILTLTFFWLLFTWAGVEIIRLSEFIFSATIGWIGILFGGYIATEIGRLLSTKSKEVKT